LLNVTSSENAYDYYGNLSEGFLPIHFRMCLKFIIGLCTNSD
jgi:hypothetical protein